MTLRLNIGGGPIDLPGFVNVDRKTGGEAYPLTLGGADGLLDADGRRTPVPDDSVDEIRASHVLEHFSHRDTEAVLREWVRALKPGGTLKIAVPDLDRIIAARAQGIPIPIDGYIMGGHVDEDDTHGAVFDEPATAALMRRCGLRDVRRWRSEIPDCAGLPISLNLQGVKRPGYAPATSEQIVAVMSVPRLGFTENARCAVEVFGVMGVRLVSYGGAYWDKALTMGIEEAVGMGAKYVLTLDYDTVFDAAAVEELHSLLDAKGGAAYAAICPVQCQRGKHRLLAHLAGPDGRPIETLNVGDLDAEVVPALAGHFGLTLFRAEAFAKLPRPWFDHHHDADGRWGPEALDADIVFWHQFIASGQKLALATHVAVGHAELMIAWPDQGFRTVHQYGDDYRRVGPPANVRR